MDIKSPLSGQLSVSGLKNIASRLELTLGQQVEVKIESIQASKNQITLQLANKILQVQSEQAQISKMEPGQLLKLIVSKTNPTVEFILQQARPEKAIPESLSAAKNASQSLSPASLKLTVLAAEKIITASEPETRPVISDKKTSQELIDTTKPVLNRLKNSTETINQSPLQTNRPALSVSDKTVISSVEIKTNTPIIDKSNPNTLTIEAKTEIFKQLLPKQESPAVAVNQLIKEIPKLLENNNVSKTLKRLAVQILQNLPQRQQLNSGPALKQSVDNAGLFLEAKLPELANALTGKTNELKLPEELQLTKDLKLNFLKFIQALKQESSVQAETRLSNIELEAIKNLLQKSENALAKIILDQFNALPKEESPKQVWNLELPFMHQSKAETVQIEFEQEKDSQNQSNEDQWSVNITLNPPNLGTIHCRLNQQNGAINSQFWSKNNQISQLIQANLDYLKQQLEDSGLTVGHINAHTGKPVQTGDKATVGMQLFDEKA